MEALGSGNVILDAIVETRQGAYGESQEFSWTGSLFFLSRGKDWFPPVVDPAKEKELKKHNLDSVEAAQERAKEIFARFITDRRSWFIDWFVPRNTGWYATILDKDQGKINVIAHNDKIVMTHHDLKLVVTGSRLVKKEGDRKVLVVGRQGPVIRIG